jgi:hypothetical protein
MNNKIGDNILGGISGGEKKRLILACHLLRNNGILILDEPLTGLDTEYQNNIFDLIENHIQQYKNLCIISIHNPTEYIYRKMKHCLYLENSIMIYKPNQFYSDFIDINLNESSLSIISQEKTKFNKSFILFQRELLLIKRDYKEFLGKFLSIILISIMQNIILGPFGTHTKHILFNDNFIDNLNYFMHLLILFFTCSIFPTTFVTPYFKYLTIIDNEINQGWYNNYNIYVVKFWLEIFIVFLSSIIYSFIVWYPITFWDSQLYWLFNINITNQMIFSTILMFIFSLTKKYTFTLSIMIIYTAFSFLFNIGYLIKYKNIYTGLLQIFSMIHLQTLSNLLLLKNYNSSYSFLIKSISILNVFEKTFQPLLLSVGCIVFFSILYHLSILF